MTAVGVTATQSGVTNVGKSRRSRRQVWSLTNR